MPDPDTLKDDLAAVKALADVLEKSDLNEIEIERGGVRLRVAKGASNTTVAMAPQMMAPAAAPSPAPVASPAPEVNAGPAAGAVTSPMVGTAYMSSSPGSAAFVQVGSSVTAGQTVMIVEAMKTMNEIKAPHGGKVTEILARDAEPVEFGETLMIIA